MKPAAMRGRDRGGETADSPAVKPRPMAALAMLADLVIRADTRLLKLSLLAALVLTIVGKALGVVAPLLLGRAVDGLAAGQSAAVQVTTAFAGLILGWAAIRFIAAAAPQLRDIIFNPIQTAAARLMTTETFGHALNLSVEFHQTKRTGSLSRIIDRGSGALSFILYGLIFNLVPTMIELVMAAVALTWAYDWRFAATAIATVVVYAIVTFAISNWRIGHRRVLNEAENEATGRAVDALINYETVKVFGGERRAVEDYNRALTTLGAANIQAANSLALLNIAQGLIMSLGLAGMALLAGSEAAAGRMGPGGITATVLMLIGLYQPLNILGFAYRQIRQSFIDLEALADLRRQNPDIADAPEALDLPQVDGVGGDLRFESVGFRHGARSEGVEDISFHAPAGTTIALVGPSGAGKTTLVRLALRLIDPQQGAVRIDGIDLRKLKISAMRSGIALVPQDVALFNDTIGANIAFARPGATPTEVYEAAKSAELADFIDNLPDGMETKVGERGLKLSGGERQRVGLARALLAGPRLLILDEATSALDSRTEAAIQATLRRARKGRTTLVVAHRLSTIADADQIVVLKRGRVAERGTHTELLALDGEYAALWKRQTRGKA